MNTYIALLRGINVSGQKKIIMKDLKSLFESLGLGEVKTYIQSGNVVFKSSLSEGVLIDQIQKAILEQYKFEVTVQVWNLESWEKVLANNPYFNNSDEIKSLYVVFLEKEPEGVNWDEIDGLIYKEDEYSLYHKVIYLNCLGGYGKSKFNNNFFEKKLKLKATTRNWKTVNKLAELAIG